jgi:hypothetical protein
MGNLLKYTNQCSDTHFMCMVIKKAINLNKNERWRSVYGETHNNK